ncbi:MAG: glycosyltransferase family 4 protein [Pirellulaceae bacterium]|nr:glycosyltransferase family 4 protein [Pirellulaceae bacterium]
MKIACIIHSLDGGGAERVMAGLATRLSQKDHDVILVTLDNGSQNRHELGQAVRRMPLDLMRESRSLIDRIHNHRRRIAMIRDALTNQNPDVVLSFCDRTNLLTLAALRKSRIPVVVSERSDPHQQNLGWFWETMRRRHYPRANRIVALTDTSAANLQTWSNTPVAVIPSAVDVPPKISDRNTAQSNRRIVAVGRLEREKGFDRLLDSFATISHDHTEWSLRILGEGSKRQQLLDQAEALGIDDRITMPGWTRPIWDELCSATLFALPSRYEGFPSALLEAMAAGVPSIAVDCESGPRAIIDHEHNGLLTSNDRGGLASGVRRMIEDTQLRERLGHEGRKVIDRFCWQKMIESYERVLREAVSESAPQPN